MINEVRNTVLSIISKDNRGYITPAEFNSFARQAQLELFDQYFYDYSNNLNKTNARLNNSGYSDITGRLSEVIDRFVIDATLVYDGVSGKFYVPGDNIVSDPKPYRIMRLAYNNNKEIEKVSQSKVLNLISSNLTTPNIYYPVYTLNDYNSGDASIKVYPTSITSNVSMLYVRHPFDPKWTWLSLTGGEPVFNQSASDYQDFELPLSDAPRLVVKILQYSGVSIREADVVQLMASEEVTDIQQKQ
jgi:hypothetical protein